MLRKNRTLKENVRRAKICELQQEDSIASMSDILGMFREDIAEFMEKGLEAQPNEEPDYCNTISATRKRS